MAVQISAGITNAILHGISAMVIKHVLPSKGAVVLVAQPLEHLFDLDSLAGLVDA
ncbi:MAG: hypothetical protein ACI85K_001232 [Hyphomicrobiaceae bacterium]|jgi:hypothetical protein